MSDLFNPRRFALLCRKEWMEEWRKKTKMYVFFPMLILCIILWWSYNMNCQNEMVRGNYGENFSDYTASNLLENAFWVFFVYAVYVISNLFSNRIANRRNRVVWLLTPASSLEKYLVSVLKVIVCLFVLFPLFLLCEEFIRVTVFSALYPKLDVEFIRFSNIIGNGSDIYFFSSWERFKNVVWISASWLSPLVLGAILWPKYSAVRTVFAAFLLALFATVFVGSLQAVLFSNHDALANAYDQLSFHEHWLTNFGSDKWVENFFIYGFIPFCWIMSYLRFKELEIIDRW